MRTIEMRKPWFRRKGERDGLVDWGAVLSRTTEWVIIAALVYTAFMFGRHFTEVYNRDTVDPAAIWNEYKSARVQGH